MKLKYLIKSKNTQIFTMGSITPKPEWVNGDVDGQNKCDKCKYCSNNSEHLEKHKQEFHDDEKKMVLFMSCEGSIEARAKICDGVSVEWRQCTGGRAMFKDGDLKTFGDEIVTVARKHNIKVFGIYRMYEPDFSLSFAGWWIKAGIDAGTFFEYDRPEDIIATR